MITLLILQVILIVFLLSIVLLLFINFVGMFFSDKKNISITNSYFHTTEDLYRTITDVSNYPDWKEELIRTELNGDVWNEYFSSVDILKYKLLQTDPNKQLIIQLESGSFPLNLVRKYRFWQQDHMSFLEIEDQLAIKKPYLRVFSTLFYDHSNYLRSMMNSMDKYLDEKTIKRSTSPFL